MRWIQKFSTVAVALAAAAPVAHGQFTYNSPTGSALPGGVSVIGGIVADLVGTNGNRVVAQRAASGLFRGSTDGRGNPIAIGTQSGFTNTILGDLGGGIQRAAFRVTLFDGDNRSGNFDFNDNFLRVNGVRVGNFSAVQTVQTNSTGALVGTGNLGNGFGGSGLYTGFFYTEDATVLGNIFTQLLATNNLLYEYDDLDPGDQNPLNFDQGIDATLIDVGQGPVVPPPSSNVVPEPSTYVLMASGLLGLAAVARRRRA